MNWWILIAFANLLLNRQKPNHWYYYTTVCFVLLICCFSSRIYHLTEWTNVRVRERKHKAQAHFHIMHAACILHV